MRSAKPSSSAISIDRGSQQIKTLEVVRAMVDSGSAQMVMGNHEFNAISFATRDPEHPG